MQRKQESKNRRPNLAKKNVIKQNISFSVNVFRGWSKRASIIQQTWGGKKGFLQPVIATMLSQKSSWRPREEFKKGNGRTQVIYLKTSVSDNDVMLSSTSRPASLWDEGMSRTTPDTRLWLCPGIRRGLAINFFSFFAFSLTCSSYVSENHLGCVALQLKTIQSPQSVCLCCTFTAKDFQSLTFTHTSKTCAKTLDRGVTTKSVGVGRGWGGANLSQA